MIRPVRLHVFIILFFLPCYTYGQNLLYLHSNTNRGLYLVDISTCSETFIGDMPEIMYDIALSPNGQLYAISAAGDLIKIDRSTGKQQGNVIRRIPEGLNALVYGPDNYLYGASRGGDIYRISPEDGSYTNLGYCGYSSGGDLTFYQGALYLAGGNTELVRINLVNPRNSKIVDRMKASNVFGIITVGSLDCQGNMPQVYATGDNKIYSVNLATAAVFPVCTLKINSIGGAASLSESSKIDKKYAGKDSTVSICLGTSATLDLMQYVPGSDRTGQWYNMTATQTRIDSKFSAESLQAGVYRFRYIVGEKLCSDTSLVTIQARGPSIVRKIATNATCDQPNGVISVTATSSSQLTYSLNNAAFQSSSTFTALGAGDYLIRIKDANGCEVKETVQLLQEKGLTVQSLTTLDARCNLNNGEVNVTAMGGNNVISYSLDNTTFQSIGMFRSLGAGQFTLTIKDGTGCSASRPITIRQRSGPVITQIQTNNIACGSTAGSITIAASGTNLPLTYALNTSLSAGRNVFENLGEGIYQVTVNDSLGCQVTQSVRIQSDCPQRVYLPTAFSPNGDGLNDSFDIRFPFPNLTILSFSVFDRWGTVIYSEPSAKKVSSGYKLWTAMRDTTAIPFGLYTYVLEVEFSPGQVHRFSGRVIAVRDKP